MIELTEFERDLGYTPRSIRQDIAASAARSRLRRSAEYDDLMAPLKQAQERAAREDREIERS
jgi:hypothetical protein